MQQINFPLEQTLYKNTKIAYSESGKGTAVVLLHGFLENQLMWKELVPELSKKNRIITIDNTMELLVVFF